MKTYFDNKRIFWLLVAATIGCSKTGSVTLPSSQKQASTSQVSTSGEQLFDNPQQALDAFSQAIESGNRPELMKIFGPEARDLLDSGDPVADEQNLKAAAALSAEKAEAVELILRDRPKQPRVAVLLGGDDWPFPIPIVEENGKWRFDTALGKEEILNRRIGDNELNVIGLCKEYAESQNEYQSVDRDGSGVRQFAAKFFSSPGKKDGLYWDAAPGEALSPMGPLIADAASDGYVKTADANGHKPFHGYYFRILTSQGPNARGGAKNYIKNGKMTEGFAMLAYPAKWDVSGDMTFIVGPDGVLYQKNLGEKTAEEAAKINKFDPDLSWRPVDL